MELAGFPLRRIVWRITEGLDSTLFVLLATLSMVGLAVLFSASYDAPGRVGGQLVNLAVAVVAMWIMAQLPPQTMMRFAVPAYVVGVALLIAVAVAGDVVNGARRWLHVGVTRFQPSEMMKLAVPLMLAWYFHKNETTLRVRDYFVAGVLLAVPLGLILRQPDLGTAGLVGTAGFFVIFFAGMSWRVIGGIAAAGAAALPLLWPFLHDYQRRRVLTLLDPSSDPLGAGYHIIQSTIAVGSGGLAGKGYKKGTQSQLGYLPARWTDFIFSVLAEENGFLGVVVVLGLYMFVLWRSFETAAMARDRVGVFLATAVASLLAFQVVYNVAMVAGLVPVKGLPLPLMSYGGSSVLSSLMAVGLILNVRMRRFAN
jgi:rod shape determining protein RodA